MSAKPRISVDAALEAAIDEAHDRFMKAKEANRRRAWDEFAGLLAKRSPKRIKRMEALQGLDKRATFEPRESRR